MKILFIQTAFIGDLFLSLPTLKRIKVKWPDAELTLYCRKGLGSLLKQLGFIDEFVEVDKKKKYWHLGPKSLKKEYDLIISPHSSIRSQLLIWSLKAKIKIGYKKGLNTLSLTHSIDRPIFWPEALRQLFLLTPIDDDIKNEFEILKSQNLFLNSDTQKDLIGEAPLPSWSKVSLKLENFNVDITKFKLPESYVVICPGSVWPTKRWKEEGFVELIKNLPLAIILLGSGDEKEICKRIETHSQNSNLVLNLCGQTQLIETLKIMSQSKGVISNDSGTQHMAALSGAKVVSLFGPTTLELGYRPWTELSRVVEVPLPCRPCGLHGSQSCPLGTHECMKSIKFDQIIMAMKDLRILNS